MSVSTDIDSLCECMFEDIDINGYLDHEIRAVEKVVSDRFSDDAQITRFKIYKNQSIRARKNMGAAFVSYNHTATVHYSTEGDRLTKILAIGHELGHIVLNHISPLNPGNTSQIKDKELETHATHFAKRIATRRSGQYGTKEFYESRYFSPDRIDQAIHDLGMVYDETLLKNQKNVK